MKSSKYFFKNRKKKSNKTITPLHLCQNSGNDMHKRKKGSVEMCNDIDNLIDNLTESGPIGLQTCKRVQTLTCANVNICNQFLGIDILDISGYQF